MNNILSSLPQEYRTDAWILAMVTAIETKLAAQESTAKETAAQILLDTLTWNLAAEERIAGITPSAGATRSDRLAALSAKWRSGGKIDLEQIQVVADAWKNGEVNVQYSDTEIVLQFTSILGIPSDLNNLISAIREVAPAHLSLSYLLKYLLIHDVEGMTIDAMQATTLDKFAGGTL